MAIPFEYGEYTADKAGPHGDERRCWRDHLFDCAMPSNLCSGGLKYQLAVQAGCQHANQVSRRGFPVMAARTKIKFAD
jgi:hypothetical protein